MAPEALEATKTTLNQNRGIPEHQSRIHRQLIHPNQRPLRPLRPQNLLLTKTGVVDTSEKLIATVVDNCDKHWITNISANFLQNLKRPQWKIEGTRGNCFMKKTWCRKSRVRLPLIKQFFCSFPSPFCAHLSVPHIKETTPDNRTNGRRSWSLLKKKFEEKYFKNKNKE